MTQRTANLHLPRNIYRTVKIEHFPFVIGDIFPRAEAPIRSFVHLSSNIRAYHNYLVEQAVSSSRALIPDICGPQPTCFLIKHGVCRHDNAIGRNFRRRVHHL